MPGRGGRRRPPRPGTGSATVGIETCVEEADGREGGPDRSPPIIPPPYRPPGSFFLKSVLVPAVEQRMVAVGSPCRVVVVDDNPTLLKTAARLLASFPGVVVVAEAASGAGALEAVDRHGPDLVLMDLAMPGMDGLEAARRLAARPGPPAVIIMTVNDLPQYRDAALAAGARGFIAKSDLAEQLLPTIRTLWPGGDPLPDDEPAGDPIPSGPPRQSGGNPPRRAQTLEVRLAS